MDPEVPKRLRLGPAKHVQSGAPKSNEKITFNSENATEMAQTLTVVDDFPRCGSQQKKGEADGLLQKCHCLLVR